MKCRFKINDDTLMIVLYCLAYLMIIGQMIGLNTFTSISFILSFAVLLILECKNIRYIKKWDILAILIISLSLISIISSCTIFSFNYLKNWIMFSAVFLFFALCMKVKINEESIKVILNMNRFSSVICILAYILRYNEAFYITNTGIKYLTFDFYNPNITALFFVCILTTGIMYYDFFEVKFEILRKTGFVCIFMYFIMKTLSRTSLIAAFFLIVICIIFKRKKYYFLPRSKMFCAIISVFPLLFSVFYMKVIDSINQKGLLSLLVGEGKGLDSRYYVWSYAYELFKKSPILGSYEYLMTTSEFSQMHNSHINVLVSYGVIVFVLVAIFLFLLLDKLVKQVKDGFKTFSVWAFIMCLILGVGEAILFSGGLSFYLIAGQFLLFANSSEGKR